MPTYVYKFVETGETIEVHQSFSDEALREAVNPRTGTTMAVKKVFQPIGITFKGGGFYKTDARSGGGSKTASTSTDGGSTSESSTATPATNPSSDTAAGTSSSSSGSTSGSTSGSSSSGTGATSSGG